MPADSPVPRRVQVVPLGFEYARIRDPIMEWRADVVVAVTYGENDALAPYLVDLLDELAANDRIELERRACDIFDLYDALGTIAGAIEDYPDDAVYVNLSAGSKITAIAGMLACMASDARPIYAKPDYGPDSERVPEDPLHEAVERTFELPTYPIDRPSEPDVAVLAFIDRNTTEEGGRYRGVAKKDLVGFVRDREFPFVAASDATTEKGYYRLLDSHVVGPFTERGYVETDRVGRQVFVTLSPEGENALRAFRYLLE